MAVTASTATELAAVTEADASQPAAVEYPERQWIVQSVGHGDAVRLATVALEHQFRQGADVLVAMELAVYYEQGNSLAWLRPDVQVTFGVGRGNRSVFKVWEEGKAPDWVLGLDLRSERRARATVLVLRDQRTGKEFDGAFDDALEASERQRRLAEDRVSAAENQLTATRDALSASRERVRELEQQL